MKQKLLNSIRLRIALLVALLCSLGTGSVWGETESWDLSSTSYSSSSTSSVTWSGTDISMVLEKGGSSTDANNYLGGTNAHTRMYASQVITWTPATGCTISSIAITTTASSYNAGFTNGTWTNGSASGSGTTVTVTPTNGASAISCTIKSATRVTAVTVTYSAAPSYTITAQSNNTTYGTVSLSGKTITGSPADGCRYATPAYTVSSGSATVVQNGNAFAVTPTSDCTVTINFEAIPSHTATFSVNGETTSDTYQEGAAIVFPDDPDDINGKTFVGWVSDAIAVATDEEPDFVESATMSTSNITYYAVFALKTTEEGVSNNTVSITASDFSTLSTSYGTANTTKTVGGESYTIEIQACKQNNMIQMRDNATLSYIYFPTLPGKITNISTTECTNSASPSGDYTGTIHIKSAKTRGNSDTNDITKLVASSGISSFSINLTGTDKSFYLLTSAGLRLNDLTVTYQISGTITTYSDYCTTVAATSVEKPTFSQASGAVTYGTTVTVTNYDDDYIYFYTTDGTDPSYDGELNPTGTTLEYSAALNITTAFTLKMIAVDEDGNSSSIASAAYTIAVPAAPTFSVSAGTYTAVQNVTISAAEGTTIYYTLDGTAPTTGSTLYTGAVRIDDNYTLKAIAVDGGGNSSIVATAAYVINIIKDGFFDFASAFTDYGSGVETTSESSEYVTDEATWTAINVTMVTSGKYRWWSSDNTLRFYNYDPASSATFSVPSGYVITKIVTTGGNFSTASTGSLSSNTWTGFANTVTLSTGSSTINFKTITVTYVPATEEVTIGAAKWTSYVSTYALSFRSGTKAYVVSAVDETVSLTSVTEVPANTPVLINAESSVTVDRIASADAVSNLLEASDGTVTGDGVDSDDDGIGEGTIYALGKKNGEVGFYLVANGVNVPAGKAYLDLSVPGVKEFLGFAFGDETKITETSESIHNSECIMLNEAGAVFDLSGRRVSKAQKGLYILNGRKVLVK